ncbi:MAG: family 43 glycosylhydrolase [Capsulimonadales bacterium]|nr:family 43 glycosylhydrolase [Capsulimonadales bacterium]
MIPAAVAPAVVSAPPQKTYCNPINVDYGYCPIPNFTEQGKHRATADPAIVVFRNEYYLFSTNQWGYWRSGDMLNWTFVPRKFLKPWHKVYDELCAPAPFVMDDALYVIGSTHTQDFPIWKSVNPRVDEWTEAVEKFQAGAWDPAFLLDDDEKLYLYYGSSNLYPIYGWEIDRKTLQPIGQRTELIRLQDEIHGWERFGEAQDNTFLRPFMEGAWVTKHNGKYYLQYGAPGTEFSGYADGVYVSDRPLGPFRYQAHNPMSYKPGGFARGAGHGATYQDVYGNWWHTSTITIAVKNNFERRIGIWPAGFDKEDLMYCNTAYGDYPHFLPHKKDQDHLNGMFAGWMLLNYAKPVRASSTLGGFSPNLAVDEDMKTYWSAKTGDAGEWFESDLGEVSTVNAIQINYADQDAEVMGKVPGLYHQYVVQASTDGTTWTTIMDKSRNRTDVPHDYIELPTPVEARYLRIENRHVPTGKFALSGFRAFGKGKGKRPEPVKNFVVLRGEYGNGADRRNAWLKWQVSPDATGYVIYCGIAPDKMYTSVMVYGSSEYYFRAMDRDRTYYFRIEAFNENGISERTAPQKSE